MMRRSGPLAVVILWLAVISIGNAQTIGNAPILPAPALPTDQIFIFRGTAPVYSTTIAALLAGLNAGVYGPASSTNGFIPLWNGVSGNLLSAGLPVGQTGNNTVVETGGTGLISTAILPSSVSLLGNSVTGTGNVVLQTSPSLVTPSIGSAGVTFLGSISGATVLLAAAKAGRSITLPNVTGNAVTTGDAGTVTNAMIATPSLTINGVTCQLGVGCTIPFSVTSTAGTTNNATLSTTPPFGGPKTYACFDARGNLISFWARCS